MSTFEELFRIDDKRIINLVLERLEERHIIEHWDKYNHEIIESWMSKINK